MTFYNREVERLSRALYSSEALAGRIIAAKRFIDSRYAEPVDLGALCEIACVSRYHFIRLFRKFYGCTPGQYLREVRVARATELLRDGMSVQAACHAVGYESVTSFSALFTRLTGTPPSRVAEKSNSG